MPWRNPRVTEFNSRDISASVPTCSGVYGLVEGNRYLFVGEAWNLQSRLLDLATVLGGQLGAVSVVFETCPEQERCCRKKSLSAEYVHGNAMAAAMSGPASG